MSSQVPPGERSPVPGTGYPQTGNNSAGYNAQRPFTPMPTDSAGSLAGNMQNLHIGRPPSPWAGAQAPRPGPGPQGMQNSGPSAFTPVGSRPMGMPFSAPVRTPQPAAPPSGMPTSGPQSFSNAARPGSLIRPAPGPAGPPYGGPPPNLAPNSNMGRPISAPFPQPANAPPRPPAVLSSSASGQLQDGLRPHFGPARNVNTSAEVNNGSSSFNQGTPATRHPFSQGPNAMNPPAGPPSVHIRSSGPVLPFSAGTMPIAQVPTSGVPPPPFPPASFPQPSAPHNGPPSASSLYGNQMWRPSSQQPNYPDNYANVLPPPPATGIQTPGMYGMPPPPRALSQTIPPVPPAMGHPSGPGVLSMGQPGSPATGAQASGTSRIDPNQIPRPASTSTSLIFETRTNNQANLPPSATSDFIVKDTGNCSPRYMRCTVNQIPCSGDLLSTSGMPLALMVQPFALPHPSEEPIQVVDFGESGPVRCSRCKGYINPFMRFIDQGRRFVCNLCELPMECYSLTWKVVLGVAVKQRQA